MIIDAIDIHEARIKAPVGAEVTQLSENKFAVNLPSDRPAPKMLESTDEVDEKPKRRSKKKDSET